MLKKYLQLRINHHLGARLYLSAESRTLPDFSIVSARLINDDAFTDAILDALWCQSNNSIDSSIGTWYYRNGTVVRNVTTDSLFVMKHPGQIALLRFKSIASGLYHCIIPDSNGINHTLVTGIYAVSLYDSSSKSNLSVIIIMSS